jgi:hypothetical protein
MNSEAEPKMQANGGCHQEIEVEHTNGDFLTALGKFQRCKGANTIADLTASTKT